MKDTCALEDIFYAKFNSQGNLLYSTLYCGKSKKKGDEGQYPKPMDFANDVKFDSEGNSIFVGSTFSKIFPTTENSYKAKYEVGEYGLSEGCIVKFNRNNQREYATFFGGYDGDEIYSIATFGNKGFWISGYTMSTNFYVTDDAFFKKNNGGASNFFTKFNSKGFPTWSTVFGSDFSYKIDDLNNCDLFLTGEQMSNGKFPVTNNAFRLNTAGGEYESYLVHIKLPFADTTYPIDTNRLKYVYLYPNPVYDRLNIIIPEKSQSKIILYDLLGKELDYYSFTEAKDHVEIDVSNLFNGWYCISIQSDNKNESAMFLKL